MLELAVAVLGPPAVGKTTLCTLLASRPGHGVFRLREHVPEAILAATATSTERLGWIDDVSVAGALDRYVETAASEAKLRVILLDNFPGSATQAAVLLSALGRWAPACEVRVVELTTDRSTLDQRIRDRRVCHQCEHDPIRDPRLPAIASPADPHRCARCDGVLHPRRGDAPRLVSARTQRFNVAISDLREAFRSQGLTVRSLEASRPAEELADELSQLLTTRSSSI
jgi:adenylate kinase